MTAALLIANVAVSVGIFVAGGSPFEASSEHLLRWGAVFGPQTTAGEWWRVVSAAFLHVDLVHLCSNMLFLAFFGSDVERLFGRARYGAIYATSAVAASLCIVLWQPVAVACGASGALFGVLGARAAYDLRQRATHPGPRSESGWREYVVLVAWLLAPGFFFPEIAIAGHVGGLACGFLLGWFMSTTEEPAHSPARKALTPVAVAIAAVVLLAGAAKLRVDRSDEVAALPLVQEASAAAARSDWGAALKHWDAAVAADPSQTSLIVARGTTRWLLGDVDGAEQDFIHVMELELRNSAAFALRATCRLTRGEFDLARSDLEHAFQLDPASDLVEVLLPGLRKLENASPEARRAWLESVGIFGAVPQR